MSTDAPGQDEPGGGDLSERDLRWIALAKEGLDPEDVVETLGLSDETAATEASELKIKLDQAGISEQLGDLVDVPTAEGELAELAAEAAQAQLADERRTWLLLRMTLSELLDLASDADSRADALKDLVDQLGISEEAAEATHELEKLHRVSETLRATVESLFEELRERLPPPEETQGSA